ncbi:sulfurtransferase TusA family protein [Stygiolobus caldivivus]|uniref:UPF0033 domain-containing protein n=1 Tax=Stygiolobus caldivivus TaxID=2824673 RepID=A0A8D5U898_9CREN|nr:sulfurtransferase TusA family protein [Stygiolobus caldivivus]BCU70792.1 hypothetical protein KN1_20890 [Stygiolobus caldivivus]
MIIDSEDVCPVVLVNVLRAFREAKDGEEIIVKTKWEAAVTELEKWCRETNNEYLGWSKEGNKFVIRMKVVKRDNNA